MSVENERRKLHKVIAKHHGRHNVNLVLDCLQAGDNSWHEEVISVHQKFISYVRSNLGRIYPNMPKLKLDK